MAIDHIALKRLFGDALSDLCNTPHIFVPWREGYLQSLRGCIGCDLGCIGGDMLVDVDGPYLGPESGLEICGFDKWALKENQEYLIETGGGANVFTFSMVTEASVSENALKRMYALMAGHASVGLDEDGAFEYHECLPLIRRLSLELPWGCVRLPINPEYYLFFSKDAGAVERVKAISAGWSVRKELDK